MGLGQTEDDALLHIISKKYWRHYLDVCGSDRIRECVTKTAMGTGPEQASEASLRLSSRPDSVKFCHGRPVGHTSRGCACGTVICKGGALRRTNTWVWPPGEHAAARESLTLEACTKWGDESAPQGPERAERVDRVWMFS